VLKHCGYTSETVGPFWLLANPGLPVDVFIILSGFVIFNLLDHKYDGYGPFIVKRFFRLYPLYVTVLAISILLAGPMQSWVETFPWPTHFIDGTLAIGKATNRFLPQQIFVHLTMLHGLVPDSVLPFSQYAIVGQAWSISVEWQFYLLAPALFLLRRQPLALAGLVVGMVLLHTRYFLGEGFALNQAQYFLLGIVCYFLYKHADRLKIDGPRIVLGATLAIAAVAWLTVRPVSLVLWILMLAAALHARIGGHNPISAISLWRIPQTLGRISYSIYLWHMIFIMLLSMAVLKAVPGIGKFDHIVIMVPATVAVTIAASWLSFALIEQPGMDFGKRVAKALRRKTPMPVSESA
jgi:peptidoglycan/LPS O-acetylase OafA/YrhL